METYRAVFARKISRKEPSFCTWTHPRGLIFPVWKRSASTSEVFPVPR
jgi:hypothetical protein